MRLPAPRRVVGPDRLRTGDPHVTNPDTPEQTAGGPLGKIAGQVKEAAGSAIGDDELAREGRLQQAQADAEQQARREAEKAEQRQDEAAVEAARAENDLERERLQNELAAQEREAAIERDRREAERSA